MTPLIRSSLACRLARLQPRNPAATRAMPRSPATLAYPQPQKLPWGFHCPSLVLHSLLRERGTTIGAKDIEIYIEKLDPFGLRITWRRYPHVYIQTRLHSYNTNFLYD